MHWDFDMYIRNRVDTSPSPVPWSTMCKQLFGFIGFMLFMFYVGEKFPAYQPVVSTHLNARIRFSLFFLLVFFFPHCYNFQQLKNGWIIILSIL